MRLGTRHRSPLKDIERPPVMLTATGSRPAARSISSARPPGAGGVHNEIPSGRKGLHGRADLYGNLWVRRAEGKARQVPEVNFRR